MKLYFVALVTTILFGCGSVGPSGWTSEIPAELVPTASQKSPNADPMRKPVISVQWIAIIDPKIKANVDTNRANYVGYTVGAFKKSLENFQGTSDIVTVQSTYYAGELYWSLRRARPDATVLLEPLLLTADSSGGLVELSIADKAIPSTVIANLNDVPVPRDALMVDVFHYALQTPPALMTGNCGLAFATKGEIPEQAEFTRPNCKSFDPRDAAIAHWYMGANKLTPSAPEFLAKSGLPLDPSKVVVSPSFFHGVKFGHASRTDYFYNNRPKSLEDADKTVFNPFVENFARIAATAVDIVEDTYREPGRLAVYVKEFDPDLASQLISRQPLTEKQVVKVGIIRKILATELAVRARRDEAFARELVAGKFGKGYREARDQAFSAYGLAIVKTMLTTFVSLGMHASMLGTSGALAAQTATMNNFSSGMSAIGQNYMLSMAPSLGNLDQAAVEVGGRTVQIEVSDQVKLRSTLKSLYDEMALTSTMPEKQTSEIRKRPVN